MLFQSAPRSAERGDALDAQRCKKLANVSIRAPPARAGQFAHTGLILPSLRFQSAPRPRGRGDRRGGGPGVGGGVSIRAPLRAGGANDLWIRSETLFHFNPRPAPRSGAIKTTRTARKAVCRVFIRIRRPAPRSGAIAGFPACFRRSEKVSIRAPLRAGGAIPCAREFSPGAGCVSIRAPLRGAGRFVLQISRARDRCFNPRPAPRSGAMTAEGVSVIERLVFQSGGPAPRSGRSARLLVPMNARARFNPRPAPRSGAMRWMPKMQETCKCFNPRPAPRSGRWCRVSEAWPQHIKTGVPRSLSKNKNDCAKRKADHVIIRSAARTSV